MSLEKQLKAFLSRKDLEDRDRGAFLTQVALPALKPAMRALLARGRADIRLGAALSPVLADAPESVPVLREAAERGLAHVALLPLVEHPEAPGDLLALSLAILRRDKGRRDRNWLAAFAVLARLDAPEAARLALAELEEARLGEGEAGLEVPSGGWNRPVGDGGDFPGSEPPPQHIGGMLLALGELGPRLLELPALVDRLERIARDGIRVAAFAVAAAGVPGGLERLVALAPELAPALGERAVAALAGALGLTPTGREAFRQLRDFGWAAGMRRAVGMQAVDLLRGGGGGDRLSEAAAILELDAVDPTVPLEALTPLVDRSLEPEVRRRVVSALAQRGVREVEAEVLERASEPAWARLLPYFGTPAAQAAMRAFVAAARPESPYEVRAAAAELELAIDPPDPAVVQRDLGRAHAIRAAVQAAARLEPEVAGATIAGARPGRAVPRPPTLLRVRRAARAGGRAEARLRRVLESLREHEDFRVALIAVEALEGAPLPRDEAVGTPGTPGWVRDFARRHQADAELEAGGAAGVASATEAAAAGAETKAAAPDEAVEPPERPVTGFRRDTEALLIAGRASTGRELTRAEIGDIVDAVADLSSMFETRLICVPAADFSGGKPGQAWFARLVCGVPVAEVSADDGPSDALPVTTLRKALERAKALPPRLWKELDEAADPVRFDAPLALYLVAAGPLAGASVVFGERTGDVEGANVYTGVDMSQARHAEGVRGVKVSSTDDVTPVDVAEAAHRKRVEEAKALGVARPAYHLIARFD